MSLVSNDFVMCVRPVSERVQTTVDGLHIRFLFFSFVIRQWFFHTLRKCGLDFRVHYLTAASLPCCLQVTTGKQQQSSGCGMDLFGGWEDIV